jgi:hypothetical protein
MKRTRLVIAFVAAVVVGLLAYAMSRPSEPRYQGLALTDWITSASWFGSASGTNIDAAFELELDYVRGTNDPTWRKASHAVKQMGPEVIPWLLKWMQRDDSAAKRRIILWLNSHPYMHVHIKTSDNCNWLADAGFRMLGENARAAWPDMVKMTSTGTFDRRYRALWCLVQTGAEGDTLRSALSGMLHDGTSRQAVLVFIKNHRKGVDDAGVEKLLREFDSTNGLQGVRN